MPLDASQDLFSDDFSDEPFWWRAARPMEVSQDGMKTEVDVLVVGSGYAGLCCALELGRAGVDVTVVDAGAIGGGASSRAAGFVSGRAGVSKQINLEKAVGPERADAILMEADEAFEHWRDAIATEEIDCDYVHKGRFVGAHTPTAYRKIAAKMTEYNQDGRGLFEMIPRADQRAYVKSPRFFGGMLIKNAGAVHPAKYHAGLLRLCRAAGGRFVPHTRVLSILSEGDKKRVVTAAGDILARRVAFAGGGYTDAAMPWLKRRIIPMSSTIMATAPLDPSLVASLLPAGCPTIDAKRVISFARPSPDGRHILFGGRARFYPLSAEKSVRILHAHMVETFPELAGVKIINAWSGLMAFTFDFLPKLGREDGVDYATACNGGSGIVMMSWLGRKMAWNILGGANRGSAFENLPFKTQPLYTGTPWFIPFIGEWYRFRDWIDLREVRSGRAD